MPARWKVVWLLVLAAQQSQLASLMPRTASAAEVVSLATRDGVLLKVSYFPGTARKGSPQAKQTTPVVFVHDFKGSRAVFANLIQKLQAIGKDKGEGDRPSFAAVTVDMRAH